MSVRLYKDSDRARWDEYVAASRNANTYHNIAWKNVIESTFGHKTYYLLHENAQGQITGILPLVHLESLIFGSFMVSMPFFNYGGVCADNAAIQEKLISEAISIAKEAKASHIEFRETQQLADDLPVKTGKVSMHLELPHDPEMLWKSLGSKLRSQIKRPEKEGMHTRIGRDDELDSFYHIFSNNMRDLGTPVYSKAFFRNILKELPDSTRINTVYSQDDKPVASGFLVDFRTTVEIPWASSLREYNHHSPNMLLYWSSLKYACESGRRTFDFGRSTPQEGTYRFKQQWGAQPVQLYWHYWTNNGAALPELNPKNPKYRMAINVWKYLPVGLTRLIGPRIVKNLP